MIQLLSVLFFISGAAGLLYETTWARYLGLFVGHEAYAQVLVLVIFLGGMALGSWIVSRFTTRLTRPLLAYALVELAIGLAGLVFHDVYLGVTGWAFDTVFPALAGAGLVSVAKWTLASLLLLPQSVLLGATFPLMSAGVLRLDPGAPGQRVAQLYFANSIGAALGALLGGFIAVPASGLPGTLVLAGIFNLLVAAGTMFLVRSRKGAPPAEVATPVSASAGDARLRRLLLVVSAGTAIASFAYEIDWIRALALVLGSATHSFDLMLSAFILGLALGAFWTRRRADRFREPLRALATVQWIMGGLALATLPLYVWSYDWMVWLLHALAKSDSGYDAFSVVRYAMCLAVMLPATFCAGITLPLITRILIVESDGEPAVGAVYAWNTLGSIVGAALAGLLALPLLGLKGTLVAGAAVDMGLGVMLFFADGQRRGRPARDAVFAGIAAVAAAALVLATPPLDRRLLTSGVYRYGSVPAPGQYETIFYRDGRTATVSVGRTPSTDEKFIATNGKADASLPAVWGKACDTGEVRQPLSGDPATQALLAVIPLAYAPHARQAAAIGMGSGMTSSLLLGDPNLERLTTVEIEPNMVAGARMFRPANARVFDDQRSTIAIADAKSFFAGAGRTFDLIVSEPSNPWVSGVATLFSTEFYGRVRRYLSDSGVFAQWFHLYDLDDQLVLTVLAALHQNFPAYEIYLVDESDIVIVAGRRPLPSPDWGVVHFPGLADRLCHFLPLTPDALNATRLASRAELAPLLESPAVAARANSDFYPRLDLGAERTRFLGSNANGISQWSAAHFSLTAPFVAARVAPVADPVAALPSIPRVEQLALAATLRRPAPPDGDDDESVRIARFRLQQWNDFLAGTAAPSDWNLWLEGMAEVEHDVAGGTQGVADRAFFARTGAYAARAHAPATVRAAIQFREAVAAWDFPAVLKAAEIIAPGGQVNDSILPPDELRDGAVVAALKTGDVARADLFFRALLPASRRADDDLRNSMLDAYLTAALHAAEAHPAR